MPTDYISPFCTTLFLSRRFSAALLLLQRQFVLAALSFSLLSFFLPVPNPIDPLATFFFLCSLLLVFLSSLSISMQTQMHCKLLSVHVTNEKMRVQPKTDVCWQHSFLNRRKNGKQGTALRHSASSGQKGEKKIRRFRQERKGSRYPSLIKSSNLPHLQPVGIAKRCADVPQCLCCLFWKIKLTCVYIQREEKNDKSKEDVLCL